MVDLEDLPCAAGFILGSGGAGGEGGALTRFVPDSSERMCLIQQVAHACAHAAQMEEAVELFLYAALPRPALHILNQQMSDLLEAALEEASASAPPILDTSQNVSALLIGCCQLPFE